MLYFEVKYRHVVSSMDIEMFRFFFEVPLRFAKDWKRRNNREFDDIVGFF